MADVLFNTEIKTNVIDLILNDEKHFREVCKNTTKNSDRQKDLYQMFIEKVLLNIDKFNNASNEGRLISYCTQTITNIWNQRNRVKTHIDGRTSDLHLLSNQSYQPEAIKQSVEIEIEEQELALSQLKLLYYNGNAIQRSQAEITMKVINLEGRTNITKASRELNKSYGAVYSAVHNTTKLLKQKI